MITQQKWKPDICIYHGGCDDGFGAAWAIWKTWPDIQFVPGIYGKEPEIDLAGKNVLMVDFSYKREVLVRLPFKNLVIIDHHKTAEAEIRIWAGCTLGTLAYDAERLCAQAYFETGSAIAAHFDMERSGATMAWDFANIEMATAGRKPPVGLQLIEDRDLWRFKFEGTKLFSAALRTYPQEFELWEKLILDPAELIREGHAVLRAHQANIAKFTADTYEACIAGYFVPCCNVPYHYASDVAHELLTLNPAAPFAAAWFYRGDGKCQFSLRSEDARLDVSEIARLFGGGGHRNAAGFQIVPMPAPRVIQPPETCK